MPNTKIESQMPLIQPLTYIDPLEQVYFPSDKEKMVVRETFFKFRWVQDMRNRSYEYFDGRTLIEYINDSIKRFNTNLYERDGLEDWQARVHDPFTRNKVLAILGRVVNVLPIATMISRGDEDIRKAEILNTMYQYSEDIVDYDEFMTNYLLEAITKGTAVGYEGMRFNERKVRDVKGDGDNITITNNTIKETCLFAEIVPLEEFYPAHVAIRTIKDMPFCFWRHEMSYDEFVSKWNGYERAKFVKPHAPLSQWREQRPFYLDYISTTVQPGNVEIVRYYDKVNDTYVIVANGVWLNPLLTKGNVEDVSPLPWNHKELPFFEVKFDIIGNWFYGKSLPDKLSAMQDVLNVLTNMLLDQSFLTIFPPMLTAGNDPIEDDYLRPGRRTPIDTQGLPLNQAYAKMDLGTPSGWHEFILQYTRKIMEEASLDQLGQGHAGVGGRTTASEIQVAQEGVAALMSLFGRLVNSGLKRKAGLRAKNILQFWTNKSYPMIQGILGDKGVSEFNGAFNLIKVDGTTLSSGNRGTKVIALFADKSKMPPQALLKAKSALQKSINGREVDYVIVDADYIRNIEFDVKMILDKRQDQVKDLEKALQLEKVRVYMSFFPQIVDVTELAAQTAEKLGDDPTKILKADAFQPPQEPGQGEPSQQLSQQPTTNVAGNMMGPSQMTGGMQNIAQLMGAK